MSLRGRYLIDRLHRAIGHRIHIPCPPYHDPAYWNEGVYRTLGPSDVYEWGNVSLQELEEYSYGLVYDSDDSSSFAVGSQDGDAKESSCTFCDTLGLPKSNRAENKEMNNILLLGCGNSRLGEEIASSELFVGSKLIQVDVSQNLISSMEMRCADFIKSGVMEFVEDDATSLSAFSNNSSLAVVDKGLVDALYCSKHPSALMQISNVMQSVNRILVPGGIFVFLTFSRPEFIFHQLEKMGTVSSKLQWNNVQVRELQSIFMYRYKKKVGGRSHKFRGSIHN